MIITVQKGKNQPYGWFQKGGGRGRSRTCDRLVRSQVLYPAELRVRGQVLFYILLQDGFSHTTL